MTRSRNGRPSDRELGMDRAITRRDFVPVGVDELLGSTAGV